MATLPNRNILDGSSSPTTATMKSAMGQLRDYLAGLLGTSGSALTLGSDTPAMVSGIAPALQVVGGNTAGSSTLNSNWHSDPASAPNLYSVKSLNGLAVTSGTLLGRYRCFGHDGAGYVEAGRISIVVDAAPSAGIVPGRVAVQTADAAGVMSDALAVDSAQRVVVYSGIVKKPTRSTTSSGTTVLTVQTNTFVLDVSSTMASRTITLPSTGIVDGQEIAIATRSAITALTINGGTIYGAPTTLAAGGYCTFIYSSASAAWFRKG